MHGAWEACLKMQHHGWRRMKFFEKMIQLTRSAYARRLKMAWDVKNWDRESTKVSWTQKLTIVLDFHESRMIHGR
jgi:hypothetical protein